ncbi:hypothetical protein RQP46_007302 [Phenoliferia psychrophenolica]
MRFITLLALAFGFAAVNAAAVGEASPNGEVYLERRGGGGWGSDKNVCDNKCPGAEGMPGPQGMPGKDGKDGMKGADGAKCQDGKPGGPGPQGYPGKDGKDGKDGKPGPSCDDLRGQVAALARAVAELQKGGGGKGGGGKGGDH